MCRPRAIRLIAFLALLGFLIPVPPHDHGGSRPGGEHQHTTTTQHFHLETPRPNGTTDNGSHHPHSRIPGSKNLDQTESISSSGPATITLTEKPELQSADLVLLPRIKCPVRVSQLNDNHTIDSPPPGVASPDLLLLNQTFLL